MKHIAVIGAGPAGSVAAYLLVKKGYKVSLIYRDETSDYKAGETIAPHGNDVIFRLGLNDLFSTKQHIPCPGNQSAFGAESLNDVDFLYSSYGKGWHLDRVVFERQLIERAEQEGVVLISGSSFDSVSEENGKWLVSTRCESNIHYIQADYLIDASGNSRALLREFGIPVHKLDQLAARVAVFKVDQAHTDHRTMVESTQHGWWYTTALSDFRRVVMFFSDTSNYEFKRCGASEVLIDSLKKTNHIWSKLNGEIKPSFNNLGMSSNELSSLVPMSFLTKPAATTWSQRIQGAGWLAVGDSAMTFDPLSSQGIYTALCSAEKAVKQIEELDQNGMLRSEVENSSYIEWAEHIFDTYIEERSLYYGTEKRWNEQKFWSCRHREL